jgi:POT family proton-dependent oligopeptide transporter
MSQIPASTPFGESSRTGTDLGHPPGLFLLFFVEMWERFSFYGMRALLIFYLIKGFLKADDEKAYAIYGAYGALVYATPYIGGMLADRFLGARLAVIWGGLLMAAGHLLMTIEAPWALYGALGLLIAGNGFFKPNISTMVGSLYPAGSPRRDAGFTIFYMGINLGAGLAPLACGYVGERYGWHYGFGLATLGMLLGVATFVAPAGLARLLILGASLAGVATMFWSTAGDLLQMTLNLPIAIALLVAGFVSFVKLGAGQVPGDLGRPRDAAGNPVAARMVIPILLASLVAIVPFALLVAGSDIPVLTLDTSALNALAAWIPATLEFTAAELLLYAVGIFAFGSILLSALAAESLERGRMFAIVILCFFSMLFWAFFEQGGSSVNNFTDRNVDRVAGGVAVVEGQVCSDVAVTQEFLGVEVAGRTWTLEDISAAQVAADKKDGYVRLEFKATEADAAAGVTVDGKPVEPGTVYPYVRTWREFLAVAAPPAARVSPSESLPALPEEETLASGLVSFTADGGDVASGLVISGNEVKASVFQAANPIFILLFGPVFSWLWGALGRRDPSPGIKFGLGLVQLGLGFGCFWMGAKAADSNGMVAMSWLVMGYLFQTTGELCLSPVGLSLVTKLSPVRVVSTIMGAWFLATSFSHILAAAIAGLTGVGGEEGGAIPPPSETVGTYGGVFGFIAAAAIGIGFFLFLISPLLNRLMALDAEESARKA